MAFAFETTPIEEESSHPGLERILLPDPITEFSLSTLTPEQLRDIDDGPGRVVHPAELAQFTRHSELNNFPLYFAPAGSIAELIYARAPCNRRFQIIYPEFAQDLQNHFHVLRKGDLRVGESRQHILLHAYRLMAALVDVTDPHVTKPDGSINRYYLWQ